MSMERLGASRSFLFPVHSLCERDPCALHRAFPAGEVIWRDGPGLTAETRCWGKNFFVVAYCELDCARGMAGWPNHADPGGLEVREAK